MHLRYLLSGICPPFSVLFFPENKVMYEVQKSTHPKFCFYSGLTF
jgi:hypothetical protein